MHLLDDSGYHSNFGSVKWKLTKCNLLMAKVAKKYKLFWTKGLVAKDNVNVIYMEASLWHEGLVI